MTPIPPDYEPCDPAPAPSSGWSKDRLIETLEGKVGELESELRLVKKSRDALAIELAQAAKYRRLDCVRIAQKYIQDVKGDGLISTAANIAHFVESGSDGSEAKQQ